MANFQSTITAEIIHTHFNVIFVDLKGTFGKLSLRN